MVELKKYKIGVRRFRLINWIGFYSLYKKEQGQRIGKGKGDRSD